MYVKVYGLRLSRIVEGFWSYNLLLGGYTIAASHGFRNAYMICQGCFPNTVSRIVDTVVLESCCTRHDALC